MRDLMPVEGCFVSVAGQDGRFCVVGSEDHKDGVRLVVANSTERMHVPPHLVGCGFVTSDIVQDVPLSRTRKTLGEGKVMRLRTLGGADQVLVEFFATSERRWLPFQHLRRIRGPKERLVRGQFEPGLAERFRLKNLAFALEHWNENTGALSHLDVDPLPHQLHLVHHILASGNLNWLIADDVGLGKTIEVGMLLSALAQRKHDRMLIVCPAGLTRQWQEELSEKFQMRDFLIYGRDFHINDPSHWPMFPRVIASMDLLKQDNHLARVRASKEWDVVVFDEAHRLSRRQWGMKLEATERYKLAQVLRDMTDNLLLLTATPHQGHRDRFVALLELLRPEWSEELHSLEMNPEVLQECVYRNRKTDVTDVAGDFIFHGQTTRAMLVPTGEAEAAFDKALQDYVRLGYQAAETGGQQGKAIGFVMTTFRKLAASSHAAILSSLERRLALLEAGRPDELESLDDERFVGEWEEAEAVRSPARSEFFAGEVRMLTELIDRGAPLLADDHKLCAFLEQLLPEVLSRRSDEKVLVFTEYRGTQQHLVDALRSRFGADYVALINGSMSVDEKREAVDQFENDAQFLVSTEAGGEGLNLHRRCHIMVNYDLPWNPMRLVQRVGRLYRYGQTEHVVVFNLHAPGTLDARVVESLYDRIDRVVGDMCALSDEFHPGMRAEIFGELASLLDVGDILDGDYTQERSMARIDAALERAREAHQLQSELLASAHGFDADELSGGLSLDVGHLRSFVLGMLRHLDCEVRAEVHDGQVVDVLLSEEMASRLGRVRTARVTFNRRFQQLANVEMMDFASPLFSALIDEAKRHQFGGSHASILLDEGKTLVTGILRWQDGQGIVMREEYATALVDEDACTELNPPIVADWLREPVSDGPPDAEEAEERVRHIDLGVEALETRLVDRSSRYLHPHQCWLFGAAWVHPDLSNNLNS